MILSFRDAGSEDVFNGITSKRARRACPLLLWKVARRKLEWMDAAAGLNDLRSPPANQLEALKDDRRGQHSIRINDQYRICFVWTASGPDDVEIVDYH
ncbi:MAG: type II toxin-antitoxin system RelE/ParE family toxin [Gemmatimonadaceae bacterium]